MSDPYGDPIPPRHGEDEYWIYSEPMPVCPVCGAILRRNRLSTRTGPERVEYGPWRCDVHSYVAPDWVYEDEEEGGDE